MQQTAPDHHYTSRTYGWSVSYPSAWEIDSLDPAFVTIQPPPTLPGGMVGVHSVLGVAGTSLDALADRWMTVEAGIAGFQILSRRRTALSDGTPAREVVNVLGMGTVGKSRKVIVLDGDRSFAINAETYLDSFPTLAPYFDRIIKSFTVVRPLDPGPGTSGPPMLGNSLPAHPLIAGVPFIRRGDAAKPDSRGRGRGGLGQAPSRKGERT
jgi:hypothetical protein